MGFDGYFKRICGVGHVYTADAMSEYMSGPEACNIEGCTSEEIIAENLVDTTNGCEFDGEPCRCGELEPLYSSPGLAYGFGAVVIHKKWDEVPAPRRVGRYV